MSTFTTAVTAAGTPISWLRLGETSGTTAADASGNGHTGTYNGSVTLGTAGLVSGDTDTAVTFPGSTSAYVSIAGASWMNTADYTVLIIFETSSATVQFPASRDNGVAGSKIWNIQINTNGTVQYTTFFGGTGQNVISSGTNYIDGQKHVCIARKSGTTMDLFIDGTKVATGTFSTFDTSTGQFVNIGRRGNATNPVNGVLDEFVWWGAGIADTDVASITSAALGSGSGATVAGVVAGLTLAAPAGTVAAGAAVAGPSTDLALAAPAGVVIAGSTVAVTGVLAQVTVAAPAGVVSASSSATVAGVTAAVAVASPAGAVTVSVDVPGPSAYVYTAAPAGSVTASSTVAGPAAAVTITALAGTAGARIITATPASRTLTVPIEARGVTVAAEPRALTVPAEPRTVTV